MSATQLSFEAGTPAFSVGESRLAPVVTQAHARPKNYTCLQGLRGLAALLVVFYHTNVSVFSQAKYFPDQPLGRFFDFGHAGVQFFFVLSGFIIYSAHSGDLGKPARLASFAWKRFRRVYPVYWIVLAWITPVFFLVPTMNGGINLNAGVLLDSVLLTHLAGHGEAILTVSWTLFHEVLFYAVFALMLVHRRIGMVAMTVWLAASVYPSSSAGNPMGAAFFFSSLHLLFGMGLAAAWLLQRRTCPFPAVVASLGAAVFLGAGMEDAWNGMLSADILNICYGVGATLLVVGLVELERLGRFRVRGSLLFLGDASYSIYLVHFPALSLSAKLFVTLTHHVAIPHLVVFGAVAAIGVLAGVVMHLAVEKPTLALIVHVEKARVRSQAASLSSRARG